MFVNTDVFFTQNKFVVLEEGKVRSKYHKEAQSTDDC